MNERHRLEDRLEQLQGLERRLAAHMRREDGRVETDWIDNAAITADDDVVERLDEAHRREVDAIRDALRRMDAGSYGVCEGCGKHVESGRLRAIPHTRLCAACARDVVE